MNINPICSSFDPPHFCEQSILLSDNPSFSKRIFSFLHNAISDLDSRKFELDLVSDTKKDFHRHRIFDFQSLMMFILQMSAAPLSEELYRFFQNSAVMPSASAFVQARDKLKPAAFQYLFHSLNKAYPGSLRHKGYRLVAVDGSDLNIAYDPDDPDTLQSMGPKSRAVNLIHINVCFDLLNRRYIDLINYGKSHHGEQRALCTMADRNTDKKTIYICDRNYPTWNVMEHIKKAGSFFLIRCKDIHSAYGLLVYLN